MFEIKRNTCQVEYLMPMKTKLSDFSVDHHGTLITTGWKKNLAQEILGSTGQTCVSVDLSIGLQVTLREVTKAIGLVL